MLLKKEDCIKRTPIAAYIYCISYFSEKINFEIWPFENIFSPMYKGRSVQKLLFYDVLKSYGRSKDFRHPLIPIFFM